MKYPIITGKNSLTESDSQKDLVEDFVPDITGQTSDPKDNVISHEELDINKGNISFLFPIFMSFKSSHKELH